MKPKIIAPRIVRNKNTYPLVRGVAVWRHNLKYIVVIPNRRAQWGIRTTDTIGGRVWFFKVNKRRDSRYKHTALNTQASSILCQNEIFDRGRVRVSLSKGVGGAVP